MTRQEFADKWGYQSTEGSGSAKFDFRKQLLKDLDKVLSVDSMVKILIKALDDVEFENENDKMNYILDVTSNFKRIANDNK